MKATSPQYASPDHSKVALDTREGSLSTRDCEYLTKVLNTAMVASQTEDSPHLLNELMEISRTPAFRSILKAIHGLSQDLGCSEKAAAEQIISTFKKLDGLWKNYALTQGLSNLSQK